MRRQFTGCVLNWTHTKIIQSQTPTLATTTHPWGLEWKINAECELNRTDTRGADVRIENYIGYSLLTVMWKVWLWFDYNIGCLITFTFKLCDIYICVVSIWSKNFWKRIGYNSLSFICLCLILQLIVKPPLLNGVPPILEKRFLIMFILKSS